MLANCLVIAWGCFFVEILVQLDTGSWAWRQPVNLATKPVLDVLAQQHFAGATDESTVTVLAATLNATPTEISTAIVNLEDHSYLTRECNDNDEFIWKLNL